MKSLYELYRQQGCLTTDSRDCPKGSIFFALRGGSFDGNKFAAQALEKGCAYAVVDDPAVAADGRYVVVADVLQALKDVAREHRRQFHIPVLAITGTNGKTTTKELVAAVLSQKYRVLWTEGNYNNDVGVPKTLLRLSSEHEIAVIEMGASHPGDIKTLAETAEPTCGLITNVGRAHLQGFGSFEGVVKTKCELYDYLRTRDEALVFLDADNEHLVAQIRDDDTLWITPYSTQADNQYQCISGELISCDPTLKMRWREPLMELQQRGASAKWHKIETHLVGAYNIRNVLAAVAVGINFGVERKKICEALEHYVPTNNRSQLIDTGRNRLIIDAYNANPSSMMAALDNFCQMSASHKMAILGDMRELGSDSEREHRRIAEALRKSGIEEVWLVGDEFAKAGSGYRLFKNVDEVKAAAAKEQIADRLILIKGSNGTRLFELTQDGLF